MTKLIKKQLEESGYDYAVAVATKVKSKMELRAVNYQL